MQKVNAELISMSEQVIECELGHVETVEKRILSQDAERKSFQKIFTPTYFQVKHYYEGEAAVIGWENWIVTLSQLPHHTEWGAHEFPR